jgi:hypothetical protein
MVLSKYRNYLNRQIFGEEFLTKSVIEANKLTLMNSMLMRENQNRTCGLPADTIFKRIKPSPQLTK